MAVGASLLTTGGSSSAVTSIATASVTPVANELIAVYIVTDNGAPTSLSGNGLTWEQEILNTTLVPITVWRSMGASPSAGAITINLGANSVISWIVVDYSGVDTSGANGSGAIRASQDTSGTASAVTSQQLTLPAAINAGNAVAAMFIHGVLEAQTAGAGYTKLGETTASGFVDQAHEWRADGTTTPSMSWATSANAAGLAIEIVAAAAAAGQQLGGMSTAFHPGRGPSRIARFWQTPRSTEVVPGLSIGGTATPFHPGRGPSRAARFWQTPRSTSIPVAAAAATGAATGEQRSADVAGGVKGATAAAQSGTRTSGISAGAKGGTGASTGQQRTADIAAIRKQAIGAQVGEQRSANVASGSHKAAGATSGQQRTAAAAVAFKQSIGVAGGQVHVSGVAVAASVAPVVPGRGAATALATTGTAITVATSGTATAGTSGGTATADATAGTVQTLDTQGEVTIE